VNRVIDANLNRATEALRVLEEIARFVLDDAGLSESLKNMRHKLCAYYENDYEKLLLSRDIRQDVGAALINPTKRGGLQSIFRANIKRLQQALRVLSEYGGADDSLRYSAYDLEIKLHKEIELKMDLKKHLLERRNLYLVTNSDNFADRDGFLDALGAALEGGVDIVQLREKEMNAKSFIELAKRVRELTALYGALFIVNDRTDIAKVVGADGVHLGQEDMDATDAREILGERAIIGVSTHKPEDALSAMNANADYIGVGPVFKTPTKPLKTPVGLEYVKWAAENVTVPFFAIGAIDSDNVDEVLNAGAKRVALIRSVMYAKSPKDAAQKFKEKLG
jgi:thiamine-phosphate pyrophosphorylase